MKQKTIQQKTKENNGQLVTSSTIFSEFDDDGSLYKDCINCGQGQYPFKHGICRLCGENNWTVEFEKPPVSKTEKLGIKELIDN